METFINNLPSTAISTLRLFATTQSQVDVFSDQLIESVKNGEVNPIELLVVLKAFEKVSDRVLKEIKDNAITEAQKHPGTSFEWNGNKIEKSELGTTYNYSVCNDPVFNQRLQIADEATKQLKERQDFLKSLKEPLTLVDEGSGEVVKIIPPLKKSTTGLKVSIR